MCYSAEVWADFTQYTKEFGADIDIKEFVRLYAQRQQSFKLKIPKGMDAPFRHPKTQEEQRIAAFIKEYNEGVVSKAMEDLQAQEERLQMAEKKLAVKETKTVRNDQRVATNKIKQFRRWILDAQRVTAEPERDNRIWPDYYAPVLIVEDGKKVVRPMRYHCRPAGMDPSIDRTKTGQVSGTYNARRDNLRRFWRHQFGHTHGVMVANQFYEMVDRDGESVEMQFNPRGGGLMFIACLWSKWEDPTGQEPPLYSFAAVTDEPEPEVLEAGHDRTIINLERHNVDIWLRPEKYGLDEMERVMDEKQHPYYEHRLAA